MGEKNHTREIDAETKKIFGERLSRLRWKKGLSRPMLAERFNVSLVSVGGWERGLRIPSLDKLLEIADYFQVSLDTLFGRDEFVGKNDESLSKNVIEDYQLKNALNLLSTVGKVRKNYRGEYVLIIPVSDENFSTDNKGVLRVVSGKRKVMAFATTLDLINFTEKVMQVTLDNSFKQVFKEQAENLLIEMEVNQIRETFLL